MLVFLDALGNAAILDRDLTAPPGGSSDGDTYLVATGGRAAAVGLLIRKCLIAWGVPEIIKTDNGSDFTAKATVRLLDALGIEQELSSPYSPEQKGTVERVIGTFQRDCAATLPGRGRGGACLHHVPDDRPVRHCRRCRSRQDCRCCSCCGLSR
ncbi:MAG: hypothetical protein ABJN98_06275 [Roseibium sp.]